MEQEHPCKGCVDAVEDSAGVGGYLCDYLTHNGHSRLKICPPREKCTVKSTCPGTQQRSGRRSVTKRLSAPAAGTSPLPDGSTASA